MHQTLINDRNIVVNLLFIRHAQSIWNAQGRWQGQADPPLSTLGKKQAKQGALKLKDFELEEVICSDLLRAKETAEIITSTLRLSSPKPESLFRERDAGDFSGLTQEEINSKFPGFLEKNKRPENYESDDSVFERLNQGIKNVITKSNSDNVGIITHGGVLRLLEEHYLWKNSPATPNLTARWFHYDQDSDKLKIGERLILVPKSTSINIEQI